MNIPNCRICGCDGHDCDLADQQTTINYCIPTLKAYIDELSKRNEILYKTLEQKMDKKELFDYWLKERIKELIS
jgi:hypothetical protein